MSGFEPFWAYAEHGGSDDVPRLAWIAEAYGQDDRFRTKRLLAGAGQGYALLAQDSWSGGDVVIKGMWWSQATLDQPREVKADLGEQRKQRESGLVAARRAAQLTQQCPVVISLESQPSPTLRRAGVPFDEDDEEGFLVQEFIGYRNTGARTLQDEIERRTRRWERYTESELLDLAEQLCNTLAALHATRHTGKGEVRGWVHADIKPENILVLGPPDRYVLIDYDAAVQIGGRITTTTAAYAPPGVEGGEEVAEMAPASERYDIYMLGATLAHAARLTRLTTRQYRGLYYGDPETQGRVRREISDQRFGPILNSVISTCLASQKYRLATVDRVRADLARARSATALLGALRALEGRS
ncbi:phosphotransferase [Streptomyces sp. NPDC058231]|uniref:phosphotransferase n=1 Tax=unclassified Streptomyces TaxID=2593676 RepID=UPI0036E00DDE